MMAAKFKKSKESSSSTSDALLAVGNDRRLLADRKEALLNEAMALLSSDTTAVQSMSEMRQSRMPSFTSTEDYSPDMDIRSNMSPRSDRIRKWTSSPDNSLSVFNPKSPSMLSDISLSSDTEFHGSTMSDTSFRPILSAHPRILGRRQSTLQSSQQPQVRRIFVHNTNIVTSKLKSPGFAEEDSLLKRKPLAHATTSDSLLGEGAEEEEEEGEEEEEEEEEKEEDVIVKRKPEKASAQAFMKESDVVGEDKGKGPLQRQDGDRPHIVLVEPDLPMPMPTKRFTIPQIRQESVTISQFTDEMLGDDHAHLSVNTFKRRRTFPDELSEPPGTPPRLPASPGLSSVVGSGLGTLETESGPAGSTAATVSIKENEHASRHEPMFKKLALLKLKARKWMKKSGVGGPELTQNEIEATNQQKKRPLVEIPRTLKLDMWKEIHPILQKIYESYKSSLGETDPLTQLAKAHMESNEAKFKGTSI